MFWDLNSMYPSTFNDDFPCGPGFEWTAVDNTMKKQLLLKTMVSKISLEWLDYMSNDNRFRSIEGFQVKIQHGWNWGEKIVGGYRLDGFCTVDGKNYALEFLGCYHHGCFKCGFEIKNVS